MTTPARFLRASTALMLLALVSCREQSSLATGPASWSEADARMAKAPSTIAVASTIMDRDASGALLLTRSDNPAAGLASYSGGIIVGTGEAWQLYLGNQSARTIWLTLASQGMGIPDGYYYSNVEVYARCFADASGTSLASLVSMTSGASNGDCSFGVNFTYDRTKYKLAMSPTYAGTGRALVTCTVQGATGCTAWTIVTASGIPNAGVARLFKYARNGSLVSVGDYGNSFAVNFSR